MSGKSSLCPTGIVQILFRCWIWDERYTLIKIINLCWKKWNLHDTGRAQHDNSNWTKHGLIRMVKDTSSRRFGELALDEDASHCPFGVKHLLASKNPNYLLLVVNKWGVCSKVDALRTTTLRVFTLLNWYSNVLIHFRNKHQPVHRPKSGPCSCMSSGKR